MFSFYRMDVEEYLDLEPIGGRPNRDTSPLRINTGYTQELLLLSNMRTLHVSKVILTDRHRLLRMSEA